MADTPKRLRSGLEAATRGYVSDEAMQADLSRAAARRDSVTNVSPGPEVTGTINARPRYRTAAEYEASMRPPSVVPAVPRSTPGLVTSVTRGSDVGMTRGAQSVRSHLEGIRTRIPGIEGAPMDSPTQKFEGLMADISYLGGPTKNLVERATAGGSTKGIVTEAEATKAATLENLVKNRLGDVGGGKQKIATAPTTEAEGKAGFKEVKKRVGNAGTRKRNRRAGDVEAADASRVQATAPKRVRKATAAADVYGGGEAVVKGETKTYNIVDALGEEGVTQAVEGVLQRGAPTNAREAAMQRLMRENALFGGVGPGSTGGSSPLPPMTSAPEGPVSAAQRSRLAGSRAEGAKEFDRLRAEDERRNATVTAARQQKVKKQRESGEELIG